MKMNRKDNSHYILRLKSVCIDEDEFYISMDNGKMCFDFRYHLCFGNNNLYIIRGAYDKLRYAIASLTSKVYEPKSEKYLKDLEIIANKKWPEVKGFSFTKNYEDFTVYTLPNGEIVDSCDVYPMRIFKEFENEGCNNRYAYAPTDNSDPIEVFPTKKEGVFRGKVPYPELIERFMTDAGVSLEDFILDDTYCIFCDVVDDPYWPKLSKSLIFNPENIVSVYK